MLLRHKLNGEYMHLRHKFKVTYPKSMTDSMTSNGWFGKASQSTAQIHIHGLRIKLWRHTIHHQAHPNIM